MVRFFAVACNSRPAIRSLIMFLTTFWLMGVRSLSTFPLQQVLKSRKELDNFRFRLSSPYDYLH